MFDEGMNVWSDYKVWYDQGQDEKFLNHLVSIEMTITRLKSLYNALNDMMQDVEKIVEHLC